MPAAIIIEKIRRAGAPYGLNLVATAAVERYDAAVTEPYRARAIAPHARTIIVVANGGGELWAALKRHADSHPGWWQRANPLDDFTHEIVEHEIAPAARAGGANVRIVYPFMNNAATLNFIELGKAAGLAGPSILGVVVHPVYGPWIAFRAAILIDQIDRRAGCRGRVRSLPLVHRAQLHSRLPGWRGRVSNRMGHPQMPNASRRRRTRLRAAMPRARGMRARPRASLSRRRTRPSSSARPARDAPVVREEREAEVKQNPTGHKDTKTRR